MWEWETDSCGGKKAEVSLWFYFCTCDNICIFDFWQRCSLCGPVTSSSSQPSTCIQCSHGRCTLAFHPTCAYAAGVQFETSDWPFPIYCTCHRHQTSHREKVGSSFLIWDSIMFGLSSMCSCLKSTEMVGCLFTCNIFLQVSACMLVSRISL